MKKATLLSIFLFIIILFNSCYIGQPVQWSETFEYDSLKDNTKYERFPLGLVYIPGKWYKAGYYQPSKQQFFYNADTIFIAVSIYPQYKFEFYKKGDSDMTFLNNYYEWESKYIAEQINGNRLIIKKDSLDNKFILWRVYNNSNVDNYQLYGIKRGSVYNLYISTKKWDEQKKNNFLEALFKENQ